MKLSVLNGDAEVVLMSCEVEREWDGTQVQVKGAPEDDSRLLNNYNMGLIETYRLGSLEIKARVEHFGFLKNNRRRILLHVEKT